MSPVNPGLFSLLMKYTDAISAGEVSSGRAVPHSSKVITFLQSFFEQYFHGRFAIDIRSFDTESKRRIVAWRRRTAVPSHDVPIVAAFERFCDMYSDVIGSSYGGGSQAMFLRFHTGFLPGLLADVEQWAKTEEYDDVREEADRCLRSLRESIHRARW